MHRQGTEPLVVCAEQRVNQEGSSPSGARMRGAVSKSGGNASLAEARGRYVRSLMRHEGESRKQARRTWSHRSTCFGGQGVRREVESEGYAEKYRAVIDLGETPDEQVGKRWDQVEPALWGRRRYSFTHRTKVFADGAIRKIHA
jgi:hypothetical protein